MAYKKPEYDLRKSYTVFAETGLIITLGMFILLAKIPIPEHQPEISTLEIKAGPPLILPPATKNEPVLIPPPPMPQVPIIIPNDSPMELPEIEFNEFNLVAILEIPPLDKEIDVEVDYELLKQVEVLPTLIGGEKAFRDQIEYPRRAIQNGIEGVVEVEFFVNKDGEVVDPVIVRSIGAVCDRAVLEAIKKVKYTPGVKDGKISEFKIKETVQFIIVDL